LRWLWRAAAEHLREQQAIPALLAADQVDFEGGTVVRRQETAEIILGEPPLVQSYVIHPLTSVHMGCCASSFHMGCSASLTCDAVKAGGLDARRAFALPIANRT
jgi:hypothetical protein